MKNKAASSLRVTYAKAVHGKEEKKRVVAVLDKHKTIMGEEVEEFEKRVGKLFGRKHTIMVNSGSSANLLAFELLNLSKGSEVITPILTFSTTIAPLVQKGLVPVFTDVKRGKYTINPDQIEGLITKKTKALMVPLLLGNVPDMAKIKSIAKKYKLFVIEDSCDTFAAKFKGKNISHYSNLTTTSFYGSHIITAGGGGGMLMFDKDIWVNEAKMLRGWGRSSSAFGESENINIRFKAKLDNIPYDAKFIFSALGYNFLPMEISAAFGNAQLDKINKFKKIRTHNFKRLYNFFSKFKKWFILPIQDKTVETAWLAFPLTIKKSAPFNRIDFAKHLEKNNIQTRPIFTGNILKQPGFKNIKSRKIRNFRYPATKEIMEGGILIGCHHGMEEKHLSKIEKVVSNYLEKAT